MMTTEDKQTTFNVVLDHSGDYGNWNLQYHPLGTGVAIVVSRGIPCEGHYHVVTSHCNTVWDIEKAIKGVVANNKEHLIKAINGFIEMQNGMFSLNYDFMRGYKESLAAVFMQSLADWIVNEAEKVERLENSDSSKT